MVKSENPKLHIKISRSDSEKDIKIMDKLNITVRDQYYWQMYTNLDNDGITLNFHILLEKFLMKMNILAIELKFF